MKFEMPIKSFRRLDVELDKEARESRCSKPGQKELNRCYGYVPVSTIPAHLGDFILPISQSELPTEEQIAALMENSPKRFHLLVPGITISTTHFVFDNRKNKVFFELRPETEIDGIVLNGSILNYILQNRAPYNANTPDGQIYVEFEFLSGFTKEDLDALVAMRRLD